MRPWAGRRLALPLAVQIILLLLGGLLVGQLATLCIVIALPPPRPFVCRLEDVAAALRGGPPASRFGRPLRRALGEAPNDSEDPRSQALRRDLARLLGTSEGEVRLRLEPPPLIAFPFAGAPRGHRRWSGRGRGVRAGGEPGPPGALIDRRGPEIGSGGRWEADHGEVLVGEFVAAFEERPGRWAVVRPPPEPAASEWQTRMLLWFLGCLLVLIPAGYAFARRLTAPLGAFALAADRLGRDPQAPPLVPAGPAEIVAAARALNEMQGRLVRYVEDRTAMIAAIAHDLRTPLARVQFKLDRMARAPAADIRGDLAQMEAMISAVLAFVRDGAGGPERGPLDLRSLLEVVVDDAAAAGTLVSLEPGETAVVTADPSALQRLFANLVDNACKYAGSARVVLAGFGTEAVVRVEDEGPGIPDSQLEQVFEPFHRLESSRSRTTGGIGLGLSVARSIARAHGGEVVLERRRDGGLAAVVRLPCDVGPKRRREAFGDAPPPPSPSPASHSEDIKA